MKIPNKRLIKEEGAGFALIVTVSLLVLLALVAVGLLTLSTVTVRSSSLGAAQAEARANARLALMLALGELQKTMGPDMRITARAETLAQDDRLGGNVGAETGKAWWVGVSHSDPEKGVFDYGDRDDRPEAIDENNPEVVWLVSGLDQSASPGQQISGAQPFDRPIPMYGEKTIATALLTGGKPIEAGSVTVQDARGQERGGFAYFIDDNGMKAQLAATNPALRNDNRDVEGGGVLPGTYDLGILDGMESMGGTEIDEYAKLGSLSDLPLIGGDMDIAREKRLGYTTQSRGVLSDVRLGGLKRDLTYAFEQDRDDLFEGRGALFPKSGRGTSFGEHYLVMDGGKYREARDLQQNGYIHWEMLYDYYNIKKHIEGSGGRGGVDYLDSIMITKEGLFNGWGNTAFGRGQLGPHQIGPSGDLPNWHKQMPYGDYSVIINRDEPGTCEQNEYKHSPVTPILSRMQQNAWVSRMPVVRGQPQKVRTNVQLWQSQYNPYNIALKVVGDSSRFGPRIIHYPQVFFTVPELGFNRVAGHSGKRQSSVPHEVVLGPGRSHVFAFKDFGDVTRGRDNDEFLYDDRVRDLTVESIYREHTLSGSLPGSMNMTIDFVLERPSLLHGANSNARNASHEVAQTMWTPFCWDVINGLPGKRFTKQVSSRELNENSMVSFTLNLRTSREGSGAIRPLVDANIRSLMGSTKWDSPLGLPVLAAYSTANEGEAEQQIPDMDTRDNPYGYTYWGAGRDPLDGYDRVILFDIPRQDLISLGQLQHAGVGRFSYEPTYIVGNSYANLRIPQDDWKASIQDTFSTTRRLGSTAIPGDFTLYDASYIVNEDLWDSHIFTTIPQVADNHSGVVDDPRPTDSYFTSVLEGEAFLPNPRFLAYEPPGSKFDVATTRMRSSLRGDSGTGAFFHNAGHLLVDGAFNVNSTSVDAWEAFLSGTHQLPFQKVSEQGKVTAFSRDGEVEGVRFPRVRSTLGGPMEKSRPDENYWIGFRSLEQDEVRELAVEIVEEVKKRGPFLTLGEFVNRKLESGELGERGALQAALDRSVNDGIDGSFEDSAGFQGIPADSTQGAGFPGQLLQGDILQALSPYMTVRSDTFTIRAYGESRDAGGEVRARAWCEATVQRYPDPVIDADSTSDALTELVKPASKFGRQFRITSFRWLSPEEI